MAAACATSTPYATPNPFSMTNMAASMAPQRQQDSNCNSGTGMSAMADEDWYNKSLSAAFRMNTSHTATNPLSSPMLQYQT